MQARSEKALSKIEQCVLYKLSYTIEGATEKAVQN
jgi:hypothetical protein